MWLCWDLNLWPLDLQSDMPPTVHGAGLYLHLISRASNDQTHISFLTTFLIFQNSSTFYLIIPGFPVAIPSTPDIQSWMYGYSTMSCSCSWESIFKHFHSKWLPCHSICECRSKRALVQYKHRWPSSINVIKGDGIHSVNFYAIYLQGRQYL